MPSFQKTQALDAHVVVAFALKSFQQLLLLFSNFQRLLGGFQLDPVKVNHFLNQQSCTCFHFSLHLSRRCLFGSQLPSLPFRKRRFTGAGATPRKRANYKAQGHYGTSAFSSKPKKKGRSGSRLLGIRFLSPSWVPKGWTTAPLPQQQNTQNKTQHFGRFHTTLSLAQRGSFSVAKSARLLENGTSGFLEKVETETHLGTKAQKETSELRL